MTSIAQKKYLRGEILGASPQKLITLLYDGAIRNIEDAKRRIEDKDPFEFTQFITKTEAIIAELTGSLKPDMAPETSLNQLRLYDFIYNELIEALNTKDLAHLANALRILKSMKSTWLETIEKAQQEQGEAQSQTMPPVEISQRPSLSFEA